MAPSREHLPFLLTAALLAGCAEKNPYLSVVTEAWADEAVENSHRAIVTGLGFGALAGALCSLDHAAWSDAGETGLGVAGPIAEWFGMDPVALVENEKVSGAFTATFQGGEVLGESATLGVRAVTPEALLEVSAHSTGTSIQPLAEATFETSDCEATKGGVSDRRGVKGGITFHSTEEKGFSLVLPAESDLDEIGRVLFTGTEVFPAEGRLGWSGQLSFGRAMIVTDDAGSIEATNEAGTWPAQVEGRRWSEEVVLDLP